ncbi:hypothetical protein Tsubulata_050848 [Turnera subulata]|uniref:Fe-S metabolism associated domain-containing protein n=1 Tax=Turnera subulata TaxID=218843 RepID=A0A9Q0G6S6_9ROSI|nr:hypothetical protein Tsubulata_050848 [Turnera subulata]
MRFWADSDSEVTHGFCACLIWVLDGAAPEEVLQVKTEDLAALNVGVPGGEISRVDTWHNVLVSMQKRTQMLVAEREGNKPFDPFPSLIVTVEGIEVKESYAEAQVGNGTWPYALLVRRWSRSSCIAARFMFLVLPFSV